jgi:hypothetical protein
MREDSPTLSAAGMQRMIHPQAMGDTNVGWWKGWHAGHVNYGHAGAPRGAQRPVEPRAKALGLGS